MITTPQIQFQDTFHPILKRNKAILQILKQNKIPPSRLKEQCNKTSCIFHKASGILEPSNI